MMSQPTSKSLEYYLSLPYTIELTPDEDGYWFAKIPLLKGCMTNGASREEALEMIDDAKRLWLETALSLGMTIPEPETEKA
ncbi:MAG: type II toxin-antitoxin system HicB family antitoxin [Chloroflexi bacterium]|nr:type II toxin-antitoxin system HicB family antitoxin [Chloroflexota bacterium]